MSLGYSFDTAKSMTLRQLATIVDVSEKRRKREFQLRASAVRLGMATQEEYEKFMKDNPHD